jgi:hypothetical protein
MNFRLSVPLTTTESQRARLVELQQVFAQACNALSPIVVQHACWNRVALHHLAYRELRQRFPGLGSQMVCNAIYSVSRACRVVYQHPDSPFHHQRLAGKPLPRVLFLPQSPVYFDRHTLSLRNGEASMFTLDGRMRFQIALSAADEERFRTQKLREIVLAQSGGVFALTFHFVDDATASPTDEAAPSLDARPEHAATEIPAHVHVVDDDPAAAGALPVSLPAAFARAPSSVRTSARNP